MVSSIAIGLGFSAWRGPKGPGSMSKVDALALRGAVVAALPPVQEPSVTPAPGQGRTDPPSLDHVITWHFIR
jgi:hypothetical protein